MCPLTKLPPLSYLPSQCRSCGASIESILDLGQLTLSGFVAPGAPDPPKAPLDLGICVACALVQLRHTVDRDQLYRTYWYRSSVNEVMQSELHDVAQQVYARTHCGPHDLVLDIGANDGTLLAHFATPTKIAFEPAQTFYDVLRSKAELVYHDFFPDYPHGEIRAHSVKAITSIAMFYGADDPKAFVREIDRLLTDDGLWIVQMQDLAQMVRATAFDNITWEHRCYYSPASFDRLLIGTGLFLSGIERRAINGGSLRFYITRKAQRNTGIGAEWEVDRLGLEQFAYRAGEHRQQLQATVMRLLDQYQLVDAYGASTKGNTLLQYCGFDNRCIRSVVERSQEKVGLETAGTRIPIVSEEDWRADPAPATLLCIWQFTEAVLKRERAYLEDQGGSFLVPLPEVTVVCGQKETV